MGVWVGVRVCCVRGSACAAIVQYRTRLSGRTRRYIRHTDTHVDQFALRKHASGGITRIRIVLPCKQSKDTDHTNACAVNCIMH